MKPAHLSPPPLSTFFATHAPVRRYLQSFESCRGESLAAPIELRSDDAYLMHLVASMHPEFKAIVDLAGPATWGASTVLWAAQIEAAASMCHRPRRKVERNHRGFQALRNIRRRTIRPRRYIFTDPRVGRPIPPPYHRLLRVTAGPYSSLSPRYRVMRGMQSHSSKSIFDANRRTIVLLKPLGLIGEDPAIQELLGWTKLAGLRLTPLRDLSPFLGYSRMAVIYPADDLDVPDLLKRIRRLFNGNFDFLTLAQQAFSLSQTNALLDARLKTLDAQFKALSEREQAVAMHAHAIETRLTSITSGTSWALMQKMMWLRLKLFPAIASARGSVAS